MDTCNSWQAPFEMPYNSAFKGSTAQGVCTAWGNSMSFGYPHTATYDGEICHFFMAADPNDPESVDYSDGAPITQVCEAANAGGGQTINCDGACSVSVELKAAPPDPENVADIGMLFGLFLVSAVLVFCARELLNLFRVNPHED